MKNKKIYTFLFAALLALRLSAPAGAASAGDLLVPVGQAVGIHLTCDGAMVSGLAEIQHRVRRGVPGQGRGPPLRRQDRGGLRRERAFRRGFFGKGEGFFRRGNLPSRGPGRQDAGNVRNAPAGIRAGSWGCGCETASRASAPLPIMTRRRGRSARWATGSACRRARGCCPFPGARFCPERVSDVVPGRRGEPGELCGLPTGEDALGVVASNTPRASSARPRRPWAAGRRCRWLRRGIRPGKAVILSTIDESGPREFDAEILRIDGLGAGTRQLTVAVTDPALLSATGGASCRECPARPFCKTASWWAPSPMCSSATPLKDTASPWKICSAPPENGNRRRP